MLKIVKLSTGVLVCCWMSIVCGQFERSVSACFNRTTKVLNFSCSSDEMLRINQVLYGYSANNSCSYMLGDCTHEEHESYSCIGRTNCDINMPSGEYGQKIPGCHLHSNYMHVNYQCVKASLSADICTTKYLTAESGYLHTPRYPNNYPQHKNCQTRISVHTWQRVHLYVLDLNLRTAENSGCEDTLYIHGGLHSKTLCGTRTKQKIFQSGSNVLTLNFTSNGNAHTKGFWLYYQALPPYVPTTTESTTPQHSTLPSQVIKYWSEMKPDNTVTKNPSQYVQQGARDTGFPIVGLVGGVLGTILCLLLIMLVLLVVKRRQNSNNGNGHQKHYESSTALQCPSNPTTPTTEMPFVYNNSNMDDKAVC